MQRKGRVDGEVRLGLSKCKNKTLFAIFRTFNTVFLWNNAWSFYNFIFLEKCKFRGKTEFNETSSNEPLTDIFRFAWINTKILFWLNQNKYFILFQLKQIVFSLLQFCVTFHKPQIHFFLTLPIIILLQTAIHII